MRNLIVKSKLDAVWQYVSDADLDAFEKIIENVGFSSYLIGKLNSPEWPHAADPSEICNQSEEDKKVRASAIYNLYISYRINHLGKFLDFGCGEGHVANYAKSSTAMSVGYDIVPNWSLEQTDKFILTTDFERVKSHGPYDIIMMYDVLDHVVDRNPADALKQAKSVLAPNGSIVVHLHPWCSRHGTHLWKLNKMHAHLVFSEEELAAMGHVGLPTVKVTNPPDAYGKWFAEADLIETWSKFAYEQTGPLFENNPLIKDRVIKSLGTSHIAYHLIEQTFYDYVLTHP